MTSAHILDFDAHTATFFLRIEYAAVLTRGAGANSLAPTAQLLSQLAAIEDLIVACFRSGGGVTPETFERLNVLVADEKRLLIDESYVETLLELIPGMRAKLSAGGVVLDAGCGDGALIITMARMFPRSAFRGYDISVDAIERAREQVAEAELPNVELAVGDVATIEEPRAYDLVLALESIHEFGFPRVALRRIVAALKRDGMFLMQEIDASSHIFRNIDHPFAPMLYALSCLHSVPVALGQDGEALGRMWGRERANQLLAEAGFRNLRFEVMAADALSYYCIATK
jgi:2-polyprenyl-3-methyl-5-hydroxy-6-metoxy-1,4-benzoquinol methylase